MKVVLFIVIYIFFLISLISGDISIIKLNENSNYFKISYDYYDDSEGYHIKSKLCMFESVEIYEKSVPLPERCNDKVVLVDSRDEIYYISLKTTSLLKFIAFIYNNATYAQHYINEKNVVPFLELDKTNYQLYTNTKIDTPIDVYYTDVNFDKLFFLLIVIIILTSVMSLINLIWIFCMFRLSSYLTNLNRSISIFFNFRIVFSLFVVYYFTITQEKSTLENLDLFVSSKIVKITIEIFDKVYRTFFLVYLFSIASGWQITRNTRTILEFKRCLIKLVIVFIFYFIDVFITDTFYIDYVLPLKNLVGFLVFYMTIVNAARRTGLSIRFNPSINENLIGDYLNSLLVKITIIKHFIIIFWFYMFLFFILYCYLNAFGHKQFSTAYLIILDNLILIPFLLVFRPRRIRIFENYYMRRDFVEPSSLCEYKLTLNADIINNSELGILTTSDNNREDIFKESLTGELPVVILNPISPSEFSNYDLSKIMSNVSIGVIIN